MVTRNVVKMVVWMRAIGDRQTNRQTDFTDRVAFKTEKRF